MKKLFTILLLVVAIISASACSLMTTNSDKSDENLSKNSTPIISDSLKIKAKSNSGFTVKGSSITGNINDDSVSLYDALIIPEGSEINAFIIDENGNETEIENMNDISLNLSENHLHIVIKYGDTTQDYYVIINGGDASDNLPKQSASSQSSSTVKPSTNPSTDPTVKPSTNPTTSSSAKSTPVWGTLDPVEYTPDLVIYDKNNPMDVKINLGSDVTSVESVQFRTPRPNTWNFKFEDGKLYIPQTLLSSAGTGKFDLKVNTNNGSITCKIYCVTKFITDETQFMSIGNTDYPMDGTYILGKNLDFNGVENIRPIGFNDTDSPIQFTGTFEGAGHTISNLNINVTTTSQKANVGVFGVNSGTISNICFKNCSVKLNGYIVGIVVGTNNGTIENVLVDGGSVTTTVNEIWDTNCFVAGFAGINGQDATIRNCICAIDSINNAKDGRFTRAFCGKTWGALINCYATNGNAKLSDYSDRIYQVTGTTDFSGYGNIDLYFNDSEVSEYYLFAKSESSGEEEILPDDSTDIGTQDGYINITDTCNGFTYTAVEAKIVGVSNKWRYAFSVKYKDADKFTNVYCLSKCLEATAEYGSFTGCAIKTRAEMVAGTTADMYAQYSTNIWKITETELPQLNVLFTYNA